MRERDYHPVYGTVTRHLPERYPQLVPNLIGSPEDWATRVAGLDQTQAADLDQARQEAAMLQCDVHVYRKIGSQFIGISFEPGSGPSVKIHEHPAISS